MDRSTPTFNILRRYALSILLPFMLSSCVWLYFQRVLIAYQQNEAVRADKPRGNLSDLYPRWLGARELLLRGRDPYSPEVTREIQAGYYGRPLDPARPNDPKDQQAFAYPLYVVWLLAPTVEMPFWMAQRATFIVLIAATAFSVFLWLETLNWPLPFDRKITWVLMTVSCLPAVQGLKLQQLTLFVAALIAVCMAAISRNRLRLAGILLAFATIKPQLVFLLVGWLGFWVSANWRERRRLFWSFAITLTLLAGASEAILPGWIGKFRTALYSYYHYTGAGGNSLLDMVFTPLGGRIVSLLLVGFLAVVLWSMRRSPAPHPQFTYSLQLTLATTLLVIPMFAPYNQVLLLPAVMGLMRAAFTLRPKGFLTGFFVFVMELSVLWPFLAAALLVSLLPMFPKFVIEKAVGMPFYSILAIPITVYTTLLILRSRLISPETRE